MSHGCARPNMPAIALPVVAELEVVAALPAVLEVRHRRRRPAACSASDPDRRRGSRCAGWSPVSMRPGTTFAGEAVLIGRIEREEVVPVAADARRGTARLPSTLVHSQLPRVVARGLVAGGRDRHQRRREVAQLLQLVALVQEADHLVVAIELEGALEGVVVGQLRARERRRCRACTCTGRSGDSCRRTTPSASRAGRRC